MAARTRLRRSPKVLAFTPLAPTPLRIEAQRLTKAHPTFAAELHSHLFFSVYYFERGRGSHRVGDADLRVREGDLFLVPPGEVHDLRRVRGQRGWVALFHADALVENASEADLFLLPRELALHAFLRRGADTRLAVPRRERARWSRRFEELAAELEERAAGYEDAARSLLRLILVDTARLASSAHGIAPASRPLLTEVFRFIEARFARPISLADVARAVGRSPAYLTDAVRRETGLPVLGWIQERRMVEARRMLLESDRGLEAIAEACGFADAGYFVRRFRKSHGITPAAWRRTRR